MITGHTLLIAHLGYPTGSFRAPMIYNPYFESIGLDAVVVPMGVKAEDYEAFLRPLFRLSNIRGALVTMPHKVSTIGLVDEVSTAAQIAGSANAILLREDGTLLADMFDGEGFVRGMRRNGRDPRGQRALVVGAGGVGSAIAASLAAAGVAGLALFDVHAPAAEALAVRLRQHYPRLDLAVGSRDPEGHHIVVNATPLGMKDGDPLPVAPERLPPQAYVGEVVMKQEITPFLAAARARGCLIQVGTDMLFEQIPAYLEFFGFPTTTADELRRVAAITY
ncbi:MAG: shikimate dehydrogenase [Alsobacter sp.]